MRTHPVTTNGHRALPDAAIDAVGEEERALRQAARSHLEAVRSLKQHVAIFLVGMIVVGGIWALTEYQNADGWPDGFGTERDGSWDPWFFWVALVWGGIVAYQAVRTYFRRPPTEAELRREMERLRER